MQKIEFMLRENWHIFVQYFILFDSTFQTGDDLKRFLKNQFFVMQIFKTNKVRGA